jgi:hypothetical protein
MTYFRTLHSLNDSDNDQKMILSFVLGEYKKLKERHPNNSLSERDVIRRYYVYCGYIYYRCLCKVQDGEEVSKNDYEDSNFCLHLNTDPEYQPVTDDTGTLNALKRLVSITEKANQFKINLKLRLYESTYLKKLIAAV